MIFPARRFKRTIILSTDNLSNCLFCTLVLETPPLLCRALKFVKKNKKLSWKSVMLMVISVTLTTWSLDNNLLMVLFKVMKTRFSKLSISIWLRLLSPAKAWLEEQLSPLLKQLLICMLKLMGLLSLVGLMVLFVCSISVCVFYHGMKIWNQVRLLQSALLCLSNQVVMVLKTLICLFRRCN